MTTTPPSTRLNRTYQLARKMSSWDGTEVVELKSSLGDPAVQKDPVLYLKAVQKVIVSMTVGKDVSGLFSDMIKAGSTQNPVQKKMVYLYLENYAESNCELALMTVNTLVKDFEDHNPMLRGLALRALCSLRLSDVLKYKQECLQVGLKDASSYVRKTAVMGVLRLFHTDPGIVEKMNFVDILYQMLRDRDPQVVTNCIAALSEILANEGGMVVNTKIAHYLLNRLHAFSEWGQCQILDLITCYQPSSEEEIFDILNILDSRFKHPNCAVVLGTIRLLVRLTEDMPQLQDDVYSRIHTPVLMFLCMEFSELVHVYLLHAQLLLTRCPQMWRKDYKSFYCRYTDPPHVKLKKVELLSQICMFESARDILNELSVYATDVNSLVARKAIQAVGRIALRLPARANSCVYKLLLLLHLNIDYITSETIAVMTNVLRKFDDILECVLPKLPVTLTGLTDSEGKAALIWILGEYGESLPNTPYVLEEVVNGISDESSALVKLELLSAIMKMFFKRAPETQEMLGRLLEHSINEDNDQDVRDRAMLYYRLLKVDLQAAKRVVCGQPKMILNIDSPIDKENYSSLVNEFNTLSVMFNKPSKEFILQQVPYIMSDVCDSSGAENNFEGEVYINGRVSSGQDLESVRRDSLFTVIPLNPEPSISATDFEQKWTNLTTVKELHLCLETVPSPRHFVETLSSCHITTMASSPPEQPIIKYFMYAQHIPSLHYFLVEVNVSVDNGMLSYVLKCENSKQAYSFTKLFLQALGLSGQPNSLLQWKACSDIPIGLKDACGVFYNNQLHIGGGSTGSPKADSMLYAYSPDVDMWKVLPPCPLKWFAMTTWNQQLVLIGGKEAAESSEHKTAMTNKIAVWGKSKWEFTLPAMLIARVSPTAVSYGQYLAIAGGRRGYLGYSVEVLDSTCMQWGRISSTPINAFPHTSTVCANKLYLLDQRSGKILHTDIPTFVKQKRDAESNSYEELSDSNESLELDSYEVADSSIWQPIPKPPVSPLRIASVGGYLTVFSHGNSGEGNLAVHAYFPETNSWYQIGKFPEVTTNISCFTTPDNKLYIAGGNSINSQYSQKMFQAAMSASSKSYQ